MKGWNESIKPSVSNLNFSLIFLTKSSFACKNLTDFAHFLHNTYKNVKILVLDSSLNIKGKTPPALVSKNVGVVPRGAFSTAPPFGDLSLTCVSGNAHPYKFFNAFVLKKQTIKATEMLIAALT